MNSDTKMLAPGLQRPSNPEAFGVPELGLLVLPDYIARGMEHNRLIFNYETSAIEGNRDVEADADFVAILNESGPSASERLISSPPDSTALPTTTDAVENLGFTDHRPTEDDGYSSLQEKITADHRGQRDEFITSLATEGPARIDPQNLSYDSTWKVLAEKFDLTNEQILLIANEDLLSADRKRILLEILGATFDEYENVSTATTEEGLKVRSPGYSSTDSLVTIPLTITAASTVIETAQIRKDKREIVTHIQSGSGTKSPLSRPLTKEELKKRIADARTSDKSTSKTTEAK